MNRHERALSKRVTLMKERHLKQEIIFVQRLESFGLCNAQTYICFVIHLSPFYVCDDAHHIHSQRKEKWPTAIQSGIKATRASDH